MNNNQPSQQPTVDEQIFIKKRDELFRRVAEAEEELGVKMVAVLDNTPFALMARLDAMPLDIWKSHTGQDKQQSSVKVSRN